MRFSFRNFSFYSPTCADNTSNGSGVTRSISKRPLAALSQIELLSGALQLVDLDGPRGLAKVIVACDLVNFATVELLAGHRGIVRIPVKAAHCPPHAVVEELSGARAATASTAQPHVAWKHSGGGTLV